MACRAGDGLMMMSACAGGSGHPAAKATPSPKYADTDCPVILAVIPARPPGSQRQAATLSNAPGVDPGRIGKELRRSSLLRSLAFTVGADVLRLSFDMGGLGDNTSGGLATYNADVAQIRQYCGG